MSCRIYKIAEITITLYSDIEITEHTFSPKFSLFRVEKQSLVNILLHHHFSLPEQIQLNKANKVYHLPPWAIYKTQNGWIYLGIAPEPGDSSLHRVVIFNNHYSIGQIYNPNDLIFRKGDIGTLTLFPTDQILLAQLLADRQGCYIHAAGMILEGQGFLFVGHSEAGKSTIVTMLQNEGEILCDDRMIVRRWPDGFKIYGTWSHGDVPIVSPKSAPLRAVLLLEQAEHNRLVPINDPKEIVRTLPFYIVKPLVSADWWEKTLDLVGQIAREVPVYRLQFDKSGEVRQVLKVFR